MDRNVSSCIEIIVNSNEIEARALGKATKKPSKIEEKTVRKHTWEKHAFFMNFGIILEGFWHHFGSQNAIKNRVKFWMRFWRPTDAPGHLQEGRPGGMRGVPGEDNGGIRERTPAENRGREPRRRQGTLEGGLARRPRWGGGSLRAFRRAGVIIQAVSRKRVVQFSAG